MRTNYHNQDIVIHAIKLNNVVNAIDINIYIVFSANLKQHNDENYDYVAAIKMLTILTCVV